MLPEFLRSLLHIYAAWHQVIEYLVSQKNDERVHLKCYERDSLKY